MRLRIVTLLILFMAALAFAWPGEIRAVDFKTRGLWQFGFGAGYNHLAKDVNGKHINQPISNDVFKARERIRQEIDAIVSETLSGTLAFEIGHIRFGEAASGGALGADGKIVKLRQAYIDFIIPDTTLKTRMGIQNVSAPSAVGESSILADSDLAAITSSIQINDNIGITGMWGRLYNDNYDGHPAGYLDNIDIFMLSVPLTFENFRINPWVIYGFQGQNAFKRLQADGSYTYQFLGNDGGNPIGALTGIPFGNVNQVRGSSPAYGSMFWAGLPITYTNDALNLEFELDYGYTQSMGRYTVEKSYYGTPYSSQRASTQREGWLVKALAEYKLNWGIPGIYGWYGTGDDGNLNNGSERIPFIYAETRLTSVLGDDALLYGGIGGNDRSMSLDGTWGLGVRVKDISFIKDVKHLLRATWIQGTNSTNMVKYAAYLCKGLADNDPALGWQGVPGDLDYYLTTNDKLLEFDFHTRVDIYENLKMGIEFDYVVNMLDKDLWKKAGNTSFSKQDMWIADVKFVYTF